MEETGAQMQGDKLGSDEVQRDIVLHENQSNCSRAVSNDWNAILNWGRDECVTLLSPFFYLSWVFREKTKCACYAVVQQMSGTIPLPTPPPLDVADRGEYS